MPVHFWSKVIFRLNLRKRSLRSTSRSRSLRSISTLLASLVGMSTLPFSFKGPSRRGEMLELLLAPWYCTFRCRYDKIAKNWGNSWIVGPIEWSWISTSDLMFLFYNNLDVVEVGIELVVLTHEIIESPHLGKYCLNKTSLDRFSSNRCNLAFMNSNFKTWIRTL